MRIEVSAPESDFLSVHIGDEVKIELTYANDGDKTLNGRVEAISGIGAADTSEDSEEATFSVYISLTDTDLTGIAYGMNTIVTSQSEGRKTTQTWMDEPDETETDELPE